MTVPTHNLYDFIYQATKNKYWIRYFYPWGSKDIFDCITYLDRENLPFNYNNDNMFYKKKLPGELLDYVPVLLCHDQEPLDFDYYNDVNISERMWEEYRITHSDVDITNLNLRLVQPHDWQKYWILLHSELNSSELQKYELTSRFIGAYWWSHALLSLDWYRFAEHDTNLNSLTKSIKKFLVYSRDTSGKRAYRKTFLEKIAKNNLSSVCQIGSFNQLHVDSDHSAVYNSLDLNLTDISVILETVYDTRIHLTEKTLRPIACAHPFIIAAGPGSLKYLHSYGFKTFHPYIQEDYDSIIDPMERMSMIINEMTRLKNLPYNDYCVVLEECKKIAKFNQKKFFSKSFFTQVKKELVTNVENARQKVLYQMDWKYYLKYRNQRKIANLSKWKSQSRERRYNYAMLLKHLKHGGTIEDYEPPF